MSGRPVTTIKGNTKWCNDCQSYQPVEFFNKNLRSKGHGLTTYCKKHVAVRYRLGKYGVNIQISDTDRCAICSSQTNLRIDHNHQTNAVRAILCHQCNIDIGIFEENPALLRAAADYLEEK